jgi:hypothetical protein
MNRTLHAALLAGAACTVASGAIAQNTLRPDIAVSFTGPSELELGLADHFKLSVTNEGYAAAINVVAVMTLPPGTTLDTAINTATGKPYFKVPSSCTFVNGATSKQLTCNFASVAVGETQSKVIDLVAPASGAAVGAFTFTTTTPNDVNAANNSTTLLTTFGHFAPNLGLAFPANMPFWVAMGRKNVLDNPMTRPSGTFTLDANGFGIAVSGQANAQMVKVGNGINVKLYDLSGTMTSEWNLTPHSSRCYQGMGYWVRLQDSYGVRICY